MERLAWLHGWPRLYLDENDKTTDESGGTSVLIGTTTRCVGCGKFQGVICVAFEDDWEPPGPDPDWPFPEDSCPVCWLHDKWVNAPYTSEYARARAAKNRADFYAGGGHGR